MHAFHFNHTSWNYIKQSDNQLESLMSYEVAAVQHRYELLNFCPNKFNIKCIVVYYVVRGNQNVN